MAIAPLIVRITAIGAAALARTSAALRAAAAAIAGAARRAVAASPALARVVAAFRAVGTAAASAARTVFGRAAPAFARLGAVLRAVGSAALRAAIIIGGPLRRALHSAADAATNLARSLGRFALRWTAILGTLLPLIIPLVESLFNLLPLVTLLAPAVLAAAGAFAALKLGMSGVGDAIKAGLEGDMEALAAAMKKLTPAARDFVKAVLAVRGGWRRLQQEVQQKLFVGLGDSLRNLVGKSLPHLAKWLGDIATLFNTFAREASAALVTPKRLAQLDFIFRNLNTFISGMLGTVKALGRAFLDIAEAAAPALGQLGTSIEGIANRFADWIAQMKDSGQLAKWIDEAKKTFGQLMEIGKEIGRVFAAIFKGTDDKGFLEAIRSSIQKLADFLKSSDGQSMIKFFSDFAKAAVTAIGWIIGAIQWFIDGIRKLREDVRGAKDAIGAAFAAIGSAAGAMFAIISAGVNAFSWIGGVLGRLGGLVAGVRNAVSAINAALNAIKTTVFIDIITRNKTQGVAKPIGGGGGGGGGGVPKFRAMGGPVRAGDPYIVGERRAELFVPNSNGRIVPSLNGLGGGGGSVRILVSPGPAAAGNPLVDTVLQMFRGGQLRLTVDRSNRVVPA